MPKIQIEICEATGVTLSIFIVSALIATCVYLNVTNDAKVAISAIEAGYDQTIAPGSSSAVWQKHK